MRLQEKISRRTNVSVEYSVMNSVEYSMRNSVGYSVINSMRNSVWFSVSDSVETSVRTVRNSIDSKLNDYVFTRKN